MTETKTLAFERSIDAPADVIYRAFTTRAGLQEWLCNNAQVTAKENSPIFCSWNKGYYMAGHFTELVENESLAFTWHGMHDPHPTSVHVSLTENGNGTTVTLEHRGIGTDEAWETTAQQLETEWNDGLDNLKRTAETGDDLRILKIPMMGVYPNTPLDEQQATKLGVPVTEGLTISGVVDGLSAASVGLQENDVIVEFDNVKMANWGEFGKIVTQHQAGDEVPVRWYRGAEEHTATMKLAPRQMLSVPDTMSELIQEAREGYADINAKLDDMLDGVTEAEANHHPAEGEWNVKQVLAHLIWLERWQQISYWGLNGGDGNVPYPANDDIHITPAISGNPTLAEVLDELKQMEALTVAVLEALPGDIVKRQASYKAIGRSVKGFMLHTKSHFSQIQETIVNAQEVLQTA